MQLKLRAYSNGAHEIAPTHEDLEALERAMEELHVASEQLQSLSEDLARQRNHYAELFRCSPYGYVVTDGDGLIRELNLAAQSLLRYPGTNVVGRPLQLFVTNESRTMLRTSLNRLLADSVGAVVSWSGVLNGGSRPKIAVDFTVGRLPSDGGALRLCWVLHRSP
ncbi:MAG TPA: PAS domain-containing protein [Burkholderiales bacterium]|nr:PAS domain-containing protein [Burkholderiales bacterium]